MLPTAEFSALHLNPAYSASPNYTRMPADAKVSVRQQCVYEGTPRRNLRQINARNIMLKSTFSGLQRCRYLHSF